MNNFEYLNRVGIGQYIPGNSWIYHLDPRTRIFSFSLFVMVIAFIPTPQAVFLAFLFVFAVLASSRISLSFALRSLLAPFPFLIVLAFLQLFTYPLGNSAVLFSIGPFIASRAGLMAGIVLLLRFSALVLLISMGAFTTSSSELVYGLRSLLRPLSKLGIPTGDFVQVVQVTLRFIPFLAISAERIAKAQAARGAEWGTGRGSLIQRARSVVPLIIPLFVTGLRQAENLALAMDARAYGANPYPSSRIRLRLERKDFLTLAVVLLFSILLFKMN